MGEVASMMKSEALEQHLHQEFDDIRMSGEWFNIAIDPAVAGTDRSGRAVPEGRGGVMLTKEQIDEMKRRALATPRAAHGWERAYADDVAALVGEVDTLRAERDLLAALPTLGASALFGLWRHTRHEPDDDSEHSLLLDRDTHPTLALEVERAIDDWCKAHGARVLRIRWVSRGFAFTETMGDAVCVVFRGAKR